ncbi:hypothetical protein CQY20_08995 [Mycolicibacterium agri]|uniref:DUF5666 domain-containing protein n=1 Tax=Mycolicibacterium agri TaxID=36811 RepID=A0A2A7N826_MYCAG|nr:hypothetical protein [Mycolicibacterium agri]PEG40010.1 hypothetical protein CQY20_08995 [Mycolicibacterium agri]GFG51524.1 hypothetical protein MAGR_29650 [Mycolicibacterium agri]
MSEPQDRSWNRRQTLAAVGVALVIGGVGGAAVYSATEGQPRGMGGPPHIANAPSHAAPFRDVNAPPVPAAAPAPQAPPEPGVVGALHGEYVVPDGHGGFITKLTQTGIVDEVTPKEVVIRSDDGFTQIYQFPSTAAASTRQLDPESTVTVEATRTGSTVTLNRIGSAPPPGN